MTGYLQRLLDSAAPEVSVAAGVRPVVRSDSPVFADNQLLALHGFESFVPTVESAAAPTEPDPVVPRGAQDSAADLHGAPGADTPPPTPDYAAALETGLITPSPLPPATPGSQREAATKPPPATTAESSGHDRPRGDDTAAPPFAPTPTLSDPAPVTDAVPPQVRVLAVTQARPDNASVETVTVPTAPVPPALAAAASPVPAATPSLAPAASEAVPPGKDMPWPATAEREVAPSQVVPRAPTPLPLSAPSDPQPPRSADAAHPVPAITIGRVTVEVLPEPRPTAVARTAATPAPQPVSAESASCIGPLGNLRAARRLFALGRA